MQHNFEKALKIVLRFEGGYSNDPADRGGETNYGITIGTLKSAFSSGIVSHTNIKNLSNKDVYNIYKKMYWNVSKCDFLPDKIDVIIFDIAVNSGNGRAGRMLQELINECSNFKLVVDGAIGPKTLAACDSVFKAINQEVPDLSKTYLFDSLVERLFMKRVEFYDALTDGSTTREINNRKFYRGWIHQRVVNLKKVVVG